MSASQRATRRWMCSGSSRELCTCHNSKQRCVIVHNGFARSWMYSLRMVKVTNLEEITLRDAINNGQVDFVVIVLMNGIGDGFLALPTIRLVASLLPSDRWILWSTQKVLRTSLSEFQKVACATL